MTLADLGWNVFCAKVGPIRIPEGKVLGRIAVEYPAKYLLFTAEGECEAVIRPRTLKTGEDVPRVGDWVVGEMLPGERKVLILEILPRVSKISRRGTGDRAKRIVKRVKEQVIATNVDVVFVVQGLDQNFNLNRIERYVAMVRESGAKPVVILNKEDIAPEAEASLAAVQGRLDGVPVHVISARTGKGLEILRVYLGRGITIAFVGSSGVGKSTLANKFLGEDSLATKEVRAKDSRGRHTTTRKELVLLPSGGVLIDTPGMRELQPWVSEESLGASFPELEALAASCRFKDCDHEKTRGCALIDAVRRGAVSEDIYRNYLKLKKESAFLDSRKLSTPTLERKKRHKKMRQGLEKYLKERG